MRSAHSQRLETWLGRDMVELLSSKMRGFHGGPIPVCATGGILATPDGDFVARDPRSLFGAESSLVQWIEDQERARRVRVARMKKQLGAITSANGLWASIGNGKRQDVAIAKTGVTGVANVSNGLWDVGAQPSAGSTSAAPAGSSPTNATTGAMRFTTPNGGDSFYIIGATLVATVGNNFVLAYDRFFQVNHNIATDPQAVSGVPARYQSTAAHGTFITVNVTTALGTGTPTYDITYVDSDGNTAEASAAQTIVASSIARRFPFAASVGNGWWFPLNSGDRGVRSITNLNLSAASTGNVDVVLGKPAMWIPTPIANQPVKFDATLSALDFAEISTTACIAFMEINKGATTATSYSGSMTFLAG
jgi:hypothetical protein